MKLITPQEKNTPVNVAKEKYKSVNGIPIRLVSLKVNFLTGDII